MPESMSVERVALLRGFGADVVRTPGSLMIEAVEPVEHKILEQDQKQPVNRHAGHRFEQPVLVSDPEHKQAYPPDNHIQRHV